MIYQNSKMLAASLESNGGTSQDVYSTEEQVIGKWVDGKPLYRKCFVDLVLPSTADKTNVANVTDLNIDTVVNLYGSIYNKGKFRTPVNLNTGNWYTVVYVDTMTASSYGPTYIQASASGAIVGRTFILTLEYTKTTDEATIQLPQTLQSTLELTTGELQFSPASASSAKELTTG